MNYSDKIATLKKNLDSLAYFSRLESSLYEIRNLVPDNDHVVNLKKLIQEKQEKTNIEPVANLLDKKCSNHSVNSIAKFIRYEIDPKKSEFFQREMAAYNEVASAKKEMNAKNSKIKEAETELEELIQEIGSCINAISYANEKLENERKSHAKEKKKKIIRLATYIPFLIIGLIVAISAIEFLLA